MAAIIVNSTDTFEQWRVKTNQIAANVENAYSNVSSISSNLTSIYANINAINSNTTAISSNLTSVYANVDAINSNVAAIRSNLTSVYGNINLINANVAATDSNVYTLQQQVGSGALGGSTVRTMTASETINVGNIVNIFNSGGNFRVRNAKSVSGYEAHGFVTANVNNGSTVNVYLSGINANVVGLTPSDVFLGATAGSITQTAPSGSGNVVHKLGVAVAANSFIFQPSAPILLT